MKEFVAAILLSASALAQIPESWHQPISQQELLWCKKVGVPLHQTPDWPKTEKPDVLIITGAQPNMQINAWERGMKIYVPVEMIRWLQISKRTLS
jgi:hypothetical protein